MPDHGAPLGRRLRMILGRLRAILARPRAILARAPESEPWTRQLAALLAPSPLPEGALAGTGRFYRVAYSPSFHPGCIITVIAEGPGSGEVSLEACGPGLLPWVHYLRQRADGAWGPGVPPPPAPERREEVGRADRRQLDRFLDGLPPAIPLVGQAMGDVGCDGMTIACEFRHHDGAIRTSRSWQASEPATYALAAAAHRLASEVLAGATSVDLLRGIGMYLADEPRGRGPSLGGP